MQRRLSKPGEGSEGRRPRISVSLEPDEFEWIQSFKQSPSHSYTVSRLLRAARLAGVTLDDATEGTGILGEFAEWLSRRRKKSKTADELSELLSAFMARN